MPKYLQVFFSKDEKKELARLAVELDTNMTAIVRKAVQEFLIKHKTETAEADDGFMDYETDRKRIVEASSECEIHGQMGADLQACVSAYYCTNWGECGGQNMSRLDDDWEKIGY